MSNYDLSDSDNEPLEKPITKNEPTEDKSDIITIAPKKKRTITPEQQEKMAAKRKENYLKKKEELKKLSAEEKAEIKKNKPKKEVPDHVKENLKKGREALQIKKQTGTIKKLDQKIKTAKKKLIDLDQDIPQQTPPPPTPQKKPIGKPKPQNIQRPAPVQIQQPRYNIRFV